MSFVGRSAELAVLGKQADGRGASFVPIWGRRRIGKSELIVRFMRDRPGIYLVGKTAPAALHIAELLREAARVLDEPLLAELPKNDWKRALTEITTRWKGPKKLVLALDEFQWLAQSSPELPSVLQELWDRHWKSNGRIMLVLCGSFVGFMEREVLGSKSPLFGRRTSQIKLEPFGHREAAHFFPKWSRAEQAKAYFVTGGVAMYLRAFDPKESVEQNIARSILDPFGVLHAEPDFLLREELRDVESYYAALLAIAEGKATMKDIAQRAGLPERSLHYYLEQLVQLGYVSRRYPITGDKPTARHVRFRLEDPLLKFWFRFLFPNMSRIGRLAPKDAFREIVLPQLDSYFGECFERLSREGLANIYEREGVRDGEIGEYWDKHVQIDVVGHRKDGWTDIGECKWGKVGSERALLDELESKLRGYPLKPHRTLRGHLFVREKPRRASKQFEWHDLEDLYA